MKKLSEWRKDTPNHCGEAKGESCPSLEQLLCRYAVKREPQLFSRLVFDNYAPQFDSHLRKSLQYCVPERLVQALLDVGVDGRQRGWVVVDLG